MTRFGGVEELRARFADTRPQIAAREIRRQVLLIDAEIADLLPLADVLRRAGFAPTIATSDDEALFDVETSPPDVVVVDAEMAERSLLARLRAMTTKVPLVLMISGSPHDAQALPLPETGDVVYLEKPVRARELLEVLTHLDSRRGATAA